MARPPLIKTAVLAALNDEARGEGRFLSAYELAVRCSCTEKSVRNAIANSRTTGARIEGAKGAGFRLVLATPPPQRLVAPTMAGRVAAAVCAIIDVLEADDQNRVLRLVRRRYDL